MCLKRRQEWNGFSGILTLLITCSALWSSLQFHSHVLPIVVPLPRMPFPVAHAEHILIIQEAGQGAPLGCFHQLLLPPVSTLSDASHAPLLCNLCNLLLQYCYLVVILYMPVSPQNIKNRLLSLNHHRYAQYQFRIHSCTNHRRSTEGFIKWPYWKKK